MSTQKSITSFFTKGSGSTTNSKAKDAPTNDVKVPTPKAHFKTSRSRASKSTSPVAQARPSDLSDIVKQHNESSDNAPISTSKPSRPRRSGQKAKPLIFDDVSDMDDEDHYSPSSDNVYSETMPTSEDEASASPTDISDMSDGFLGPPKKRSKVAATKKKGVKSSLDDDLSDLEMEDVLDDIKLDAPNAKARQINKDSFRKDWKVEIDLTLPPLSKQSEIMAHMVNKAVELNVAQVTRHLKGRPLRIGTMCSGTESPILALQCFQDVLTDHNLRLDVDHVFSAEIVPWKQAYIERNFPSSLIFRDVVEIGKEKEVDEAHTAYGSKEPIPGDLDILIAGSSCVDFSNLNVKKKKLSDGGESGDTFTGVMSYAQRHKPKIILLENVVGNTKVWNDLQKAVASYGYTCQWVKVDTKQYYLPQTRERGYLMAVADDNEEGIEPQRVVNKWKELMIKFQRKASSSVEAFLLDDDDTRVMNGRAEVEKTGKFRADSDWARNVARHRNYRTDLQLGHKRPITEWEDGGSTKGPDYYWRKWFARQPERVWDMIDSTFLRGMARGYDQGFKSRFLDLSQAIDRETDGKGAGIIGCLTPKGIPFSTVRGGLILGIECLAMQGLPIDKLQVLRETQAELQDLAGNAMSTTVIGASILSALISGFKLLPDAKQAAKGQSRNHEDGAFDPYEIVNIEELVLSSSNDQLTPVSKSEVLDLALKSLRMCPCEGQQGIASSPIQKCRLCKNTSCTDCGVDQRHKYSFISPDRIAPTSFERFIKGHLPMKIKLTGISPDEVKDLYLRQAISAKVWQACSDEIEKALTSEVRFHSIKRSEIWTVNFKSSSARLDLLISPGYFEWRFYAEPDPQWAGNHKGRKHLSQPLLRMQPSKSNVLHGKWQVWLPTARSFKAKLRGQGKLVKTYPDEVGLLTALDTVQWDTYHITADTKDVENLDTNISGTYKLVRCPGKVAERSLHVKVEEDYSEAPLYLFLDPHRMLDPKDDGYVISTDTRRLNYGEARHRIASIDSAWRPPVYSRVELPSQPGIFGYIPQGSKKSAASASPAHLQTTIDIIVGGAWEDVPAVRFDTLAEDLQSKTGHPSTKFADAVAQSTCCSPSLVLDCKAQLPAQEASMWKREKWLTVDETSHREFFREFAWLLEKNSSISHLGSWYEAQWPDDYCTTCAPELPTIKWSIPDDSGQKLRPFEDPKDAGPFERKMKNRPPPFVTKIFINQGGSVRLKLGFNPNTLVHRAISNLSMSDNTAISWRLVTDYIVPSKPDLPAFVLRDNDDDTPADQPPGFNDQFKLRPEQLRSLGWQIMQELNPPNFSEEEVEEAFMPHIGWRAEGRATKSVSVRGGVLAHEVGYGKTIVTLALISSQRKHDEKLSQEAVPGRIPTKATLILVPRQLYQQWHTEANKFLRRDQKYKIEVVRDLSDLLKLTIEQVKNADIIIAPWNIFEGEDYMFLVAQFAGLVELPSGASPRAHSAWYKQAKQEIAENIDHLKDEKPSLYTKVLNKYDSEVDKAAKVETVIPSKRLKGQAYQDAKKAMTMGVTAKTGSKRKREDHSAVKAREDPFELKALDKGRPWKRGKCPLLESFQFARVVVDEYEYAKGMAGVLIAALSSRSRWILSATPSMEDFADIKSMARNIGINLGVDDMSPEATKPSNIKLIEDDQTSAEKFRSKAKKAPSPFWHENRHAHAQRFLDKFVRQDKAHLDKIAGSEHLVTVDLPAAERAVYIELYKALAAKNFTLVKKKTKSSENDRANRVADILGDSTTVTEALMRCAAHFELRNLELSEKVGLTLAMLNDRASRYKSECKTFKQQLKKAEWLRHNNGNWVCHSYTSFKQHVKENVLGDEETTKEVQKMINDAEEDYEFKHMQEFYRTQAQIDKALANDAKMAAKAKAGKTTEKIDRNLAYRGHPLIEPVGKSRDEEARKTVKALQTTAKELVSQKRSLRLFKSILQFEELAAKQRSSSKSADGLSCAKCLKEYKDLNILSVLAECGHIFCLDCLRVMDGACGSSVCNAPYSSHEVFPAIDFTVEDDLDRDRKRYGRKVEDLVKLVTSIPSEDQVLLFVQFVGLGHVVREALEEHNIPVAALTDSRDPSKVLQKFQDDDSDQKSKVLILNIGDSSAAGSNLTRANHIIFVSPYDADNDQQYQAAMTQAKGRARRYGQMKHVHIYQFLTLRTVDVDTIQNRTGTVLKMVPSASNPDVRPYKGFKPGKFKLEEAALGEKGEFGSPILNVPMDDLDDE